MLIMCVRCSVLRLCSQHRRAHDLNISAFQLEPIEFVSGECSSTINAFIHCFSLKKNKFSLKRNHFSLKKNHHHSKKNVFSLKRNDFSLKKIYFSLKKNDFSLKKNHFSLRKNRLIFL